MAKSRFRQVRLRSGISQFAAAVWPVSTVLSARVPDLEADGPVREWVGTLHQHLKTQTGRRKLQSGTFEKERTATELSES
jgi:hypothetical protein